MNKIILPQIISVGIYNSQLAIKNRTVSKNRKTTMFEIELPIEETGVSYIDNDEHPIKNNLVICAKPGQIRHTRLPYKCYYIHMIVNDGHLWDVLSLLPNFIELTNAERIKEIFISLCEHYNTGIDDDQILLYSLIFELIYILKNKAKSNTKFKPKNNNHYIIEKTLEYIKNNLESNLSLETLAKTANFNAVYFHKLFKAAIGKTLREYIEEQRLKKAINLLISTNMTITQIAYECGFSSQSYFNYAFKRKMKVSPREYAKSLQLKYEDR